MGPFVYRPPSHVPYQQTAPRRKLPRTSLAVPVFDAGEPFTIRAGNPTTLIAPFTENRAAQTEAGLVLFDIESGTPRIDYQPWGYGGWGDGGGWGEWEPRMLHLRSATGDIVTVDPTDYLDPVKGSLAFRIVRYTDTGTAELFLECGEDGADWLRLYVGSNDKLTLSWSSDGGSEQTIESAGTIQPNTLYFVACDWQRRAMSLRVDTRDRVSGTRDDPAGDWGAGLLQLKAA